MPNLEETKTAELRKLAEKAEIPNWETLERPGLLDALKPKESKKEVKVEKKVKGKTKKKKEPKEKIELPKKVEDKVATHGVEELRYRRGGKAEAMRKRLAKQPKVRILIPLVDKEARGSTFPVNLNGYRLNIQKGVYVNVPEQVGDVVADSQKQTVLASQHERLLDDNVDKGKANALDL